MINVEGRVREDRRSKGTVTNSRAKANHLTFSKHGIVGVNEEGNDNSNNSPESHGKKRLEPKPTEEHKHLGKKVVTDDELHRRFGCPKRKGLRHLKPYHVEHDGEEKPRHAPPAANLTSRQRAEKIIAEAVKQDPTLKDAVEHAVERKGVDSGVFEAVKVVQRAEAAKHVEKRDTQAAHLRGDNEPSKLAAPFAQKSTVPSESEKTMFHKRMLNPPEEPDQRAEGIRRVAQEGRDTPFDTKVARFYPDPPQFGKGREIWSAHGKRRGDPTVAPHDLDEMAQRKAIARCGQKASEKEFPEFVLGNPSPAPSRGKNSSPEKNDSHFSLGNGYGPAAGLPAEKRPPSAAASSARNTRNGFAHLKNHSTALW